MSLFLSILFAACNDEGTVISSFEVERVVPNMQARDHIIGLKIFPGFTGDWF